MLFKLILCGFFICITQLFKFLVNVAVMLFMKMYDLTCGGHFIKHIPSLCSLTGFRKMLLRDQNHIGSFIILSESGILSSDKLRNRCIGCVKVRLRCKVCRKLVKIAVSDDAPRLLIAFGIGNNAVCHFCPSVADGRLELIGHSGFKEFCRNV